MKRCKWTYSYMRVDKKESNMQKITNICFFMLFPISIKTYKVPFKINFITKNELQKYIKECNDPKKYIQCRYFKLFGIAFEIQKGWNPFCI